MSDPRHLEAREAELSVLGAILLDPDAFDVVSASLKPEAFHAPRHRVVFAAMRALAAASDPIDVVTLSEHLERAGELDGIGGFGYLAELADAAATSVNAEHHAGLVLEAHQTRRLVSELERVAKLARSGDYATQAALVDEAQRAVLAATEHRGMDSLVPVRTGLRQAVERVQRAYTTRSPVTGTPSGFADLDGKTAGLHPGELIILAARPAMGKTALALNLAVNAARLGACSVVVFSLEMPTIELCARMLAAEARIDGERMKTGFLGDGDIDRLLQACRALSGIPVHIDDTSGASPEALRAKCRRVAGTKGAPPLGLVVVDYLQLLKVERKRGGSREQEIAEISRSLKGLAKDLSVPILALSQLNRGVESRPNKRPGLADLRESGAIEQDADVVMFCYRDEYYNEQSEDKGVAEVIIGKNRSGSVGTVKLKFTPAWTRFDDLAPGHSATWGARDGS